VRPLARHAGLAVALLLNAAILWHFHDRFWWPPDEGSYAHVAERMLDGEVLNRDVQDIHAGAINFLNAAAMALFGRHMLALRYPLVLAALLQAGLVFHLFRRHGAVVALVASVTATAVGVVQFLDPTAHWYSQVLFWGLVVHLDRTTQNDPHLERPWRAETVGLLLGTLFLVRQLSAVLAAMGAVAFLLAQASAAARPQRPLLARSLVALLALGLVGYLSFATDRVGWLLFGIGPLGLLAWLATRTQADGRALRRTIGRMVLGAVASALPLAAYHLAHGSLGSWWHDTVVVAATVPQLPFVIQQNFLSDLIGPGLLNLLLPGSVTAALSGLYWFVLPLSATWLALALYARLRHAEESPSALLVLAPFYALVSIHYQNATYLAFAVAVPLLATLSWAAAAGAWQRRLATTACTALSAIGLVFHAGQSANRDLVELLDGVREPVVDSSALLPRCRLQIDPQDLELYGRIQALVEREVPPGEPIFALPSNAELYFLTGRPNPFRFYNVLLGAASPAQEQAILEQLEREPPRLIFYQASDKYALPAVRRLLATLEPGYEELAGELPSAAHHSFVVLRRRVP
jgi:hypothetical protein